MIGNFSSLLIIGFHTSYTIIEAGEEELVKEEVGKEEVRKEDIGKEDVDKKKIGKADIGKAEDLHQLNV